MVSAEKRKDGATARLAKGSIHVAILCCSVLVWFIIVVVNTMANSKWKKEFIWSTCYRASLREANVAT